MICPPVCASARTGDCVVKKYRHRGDQPIVQLATCATAAYVVLQRAEEANDDVTACRDMPGYEYSYSYDRPLSADLDYMLCLRRSWRPLPPPSRHVPAWFGRSVPWAGDAGMRVGERACFAGGFAGYTSFAALR